MVFSGVTSGDPLMKKRVEAANALNKYISLQQAVSENRSLLSYEYSSIPAKIDTELGIENNF